MTGIITITKELTSPTAVMVMARVVMVCRAMIVTKETGITIMTGVIPAIINKEITAITMHNMAMVMLTKETGNTVTETTVNNIPDA